MKLKSYLAITTFLICGRSWAAVALQPMDLGGGPQQTVSWEAGTLKRVNFGAGGDKETSVPTSGTGTIVPTGTGYRAGFGYYSFSSDFGLSASTSVQNNAFADIQSVVFQRVSMMNPGTDEAPLTAYDNLVFGGGAVLTYTYLDSNLATVSVNVPAGYWAVSGGVYDDSSGFPGTYYNFAYQWDLSGVSETITSVTINSPIMVHSSTSEAQIDIAGGTFVQVIPEPASSALLSFGLAGLLIRRRR